MLEKVIPVWKVVFSGDTRPCPELIEASHGPTVLIHEASYDIYCVFLFCLSDNKIVQFSKKL